MTKYRKTKKGLIRNLYCGIKQRATETGKELSFSSQAFFRWCMVSRKFHALYIGWVKADFERNVKPSIDRKNPLIGYRFDNIQVMTYWDNILKGRLEQELLIGRPIIQTSLDGIEIERFASVRRAANELKLSQGNISMVLAGLRNKTGGFSFKYQPR